MIKSKTDITVRNAAGYKVNSNILVEQTGGSYKSGDILDANAVEKLIGNSGQKVLPDCIIPEEDGLYQIKDSEVYPVAHPDLSTQPSILPQRYGNLPINEVLIPLTAGVEWDISSYVPSDSMVIECSLFSNETFASPLMEKKNGKWILGVGNIYTDVEPNEWWALVRYVGPDNGYYYYGGEGGGDTPVIDYSTRYLTTEALGQGAIGFNIWSTMGTDYITSISYSTDNGQTWTTTNNEDDKEENLVIKVEVNAGDKVLWKGDAQQTGFYDDNEGDYLGSFFSSEFCDFNAYGNVMSLCYGDNFIGQTTLNHDGQFSCLFSDYNDSEICQIVSAENLILPVTTLTNGCYYYMFYGCKTLTIAPKLPATTLANYCYSGMFYNCTSLRKAPELPATTLANNCYKSMFFDCTSLTTVHGLPATTLANNCYESMFSGCTSLNYIKCLATDISADMCTSNWVYNVAASGTFVKNASMSSWTTGTSGIPSGWTVQNAS